MTDTLEQRLRRVKFMRTDWLEPHGEVEMVVFDDMQGQDGVYPSPVNPDGPEAADLIRDMLEALRDARDELYHSEHSSGDPHNESNMQSDAVTYRTVCAVLAKAEQGL